MPFWGTYPSQEKPTLTHSCAIFYSDSVAV